MSVFSGHQGCLNKQQTEAKIGLPRQGNILNLTGINREFREKKTSELQWK
jgi:hypothetical protein